MFPAIIWKILYRLAIIGILVLVARGLPARFRAVERSYEESQVPEPLPTGVVGCVMWGLGIAIASSFFALRQANYWWASLDGPSVLTQYATPFIWCFFPGFAALAVPWPLTVWYLRRIGRWEEADCIEDDADSKGGLNSYLLAKWMSIVIVAPIGIFTSLAIPIHLSIGDSEIRVGHYASLKSETYSISEARKLTLVEGYRLRDGTFKNAKDVIIDFAGGRRLRGNQVGDGGTDVRDDVLQLLIAKTKLTPQHALTAEDVPLLQRKE